MRAQRVGGSMLVVGSIVTVVGLTSAANLEDGEISEGFVLGVAGSYVASAGFWTLITGSISREVLRQRERRQAPPPSMMPTASTPNESQPGAPAISDELLLVADDLCSMVPDDCIAVRACLLYRDALACAAVDTLVETGVLSETLWRFAQTAADEAR